MKSTAGNMIPTSLADMAAAAANRDPRIFDDPDRFIVDRKDPCQREPRGQYRADGLASGIVFGLASAIGFDRKQSIQFGLVFSFDQRFNDNIGERKSILNLEHGYIQ